MAAVSAMAPEEMVQFLCYQQHVGFLGTEQGKLNEYKEGWDEQNDYVFHEGLLYVP